MKTCLAGSIILVLGAASLNASAEEFSWGDVTFQPRAYVGYANYSLESGAFTYIEEGVDPIRGTLVFDTAGHDKIDINGPLFGVGATLASGRFFGDFYYQSTLDETVYSGREVEDEGFVYNDGNVDAQHSDWALSLGYLITDQWSVFAGYKSGSTDWDQSFQGRPVELNPDVTNTEGNLSGEFDQDGPFLGASYSVPIGPGALTFKAAYAYLDGTVKWNYREDVFNGGTDPFATLIRRYTLDGNSNAYSVGVSWTQSVTDNFGYSIGANYHRYEFDMSGTSVGELTNTPETNTRIDGGTLTEEMFTLTASAIYRF